MISHLRPKCKHGISMFNDCIACDEERTTDEFDDHRGPDNSYIKKYYSSLWTYLYILETSDKFCRGDFVAAPCWLNHFWCNFWKRATLL